MSEVPLYIRVVLQVRTFRRLRRMSRCWKCCLSYSRLIYFVYHLTLHLRIRKKIKKTHIPEIAEDVKMLEVLSFCRDVSSPLWTSEVYGPTS